MAVALVALLVGLGVVVAVRSAATGGIVIERGAGAAPDGAEAEVGAEAAPPEPAVLVVHVDGAVAAPGVYELAEGSRAVDAVNAAGGLAEGADLTSINLAAPLSDGEKIHVPREGEQATQPVGAGASAGGQGTARSAPGLVNINTATAEELCSLPGVGEATAEAIIEDRAANGPFSAPEDLMRVSGIGEKKFAKLQGKICV